MLQFPNALKLAMWLTNHYGLITSVLRSACGAKIWRSKVWQKDGRTDRRRAKWSQRCSLLPLPPPPPSPKEGKVYRSPFCPRLSRKWGTLNLIRPSVPPSVRPSVRHKNYNLAHIFWSINDRALIFGMHDPCDRPFQLTPCRDLDLNLWPTSRSNLLPGGGPQFSEFACCF